MFTGSQEKTAEDNVSAILLKIGNGGRVVREYVPDKSTRFSPYPAKVRGMRSV